MSELLEVNRFLNSTARNKFFLGNNDHLYWRKLQKIFRLLSLTLQPNIHPQMFWHSSQSNRCLSLLQPAHIISVCLTSTLAHQNSIYSISCSTLNNLLCYRKQKLKLHSTKEICISFLSTLSFRARQLGKTLFVSLLLFIIILFSSNLSSTLRMTMSIV